jgi:hypothetical protein
MNVIDQLRQMGNESHKMIEAFENYAYSDFDPVTCYRHSWITLKRSTCPRVRGP